MKLFLTSTGIKDEYKTEFLSFIKRNPKDMTVVFIPTAGFDPTDVVSTDTKPEDLKGQETGLITEALNSLYEMGFKVIEFDIAGKSSAELKEVFSEADIVYVNGGNTYYLMDQINRSGLKQIIEELNLIYVGVSAGSIVAGIDIDIAGWHPNWDKNLIGLKDTKGLGLVDFAISPHFIDSDREVLVAKARDVEYPIIGINNRQAIIVEGKNIKLVGERERIIYNWKTPF